jgi:hypothetical protein
MHCLHCPMGQPAASTYIHAPLTTGAGPSRRLRRSRAAWHHGQPATHPVSSPRCTTILLAILLLTLHCSHYVLSSATSVSAPPYCTISRAACA